MIAENIDALSVNKNSVAEDTTAVIQQVITSPLSPVEGQRSDSAIRCSLSQ